MKGRILVIDDNKGILDAFKAILEDESYAVLTSEDGDLKVINGLKPPDLVLLDIFLSGKDGRDICRKLKTNKKTKNIPIIMVSAGKDASRMAKEAGSDDFIAKPFDMDELLSKIEAWIKR